MCLNIASGHVRRHFDVSEVLDVQFPPIFATQVRIWAYLMVNPISHHVLGECKPQEVVILVLFFCVSAPRGQLALMMKRAAQALMPRHNAAPWSMTTEALRFS
jgi:hypothetical protein